MTNFEIGAQLYAFRSHLIDKGEDEIHSFLKQIKDMGYKAIQISGIGDITSQMAEIYSRVCKELNLKICATHVSFDALENNLDWVIEYHKMWNCGYLGVGSIPDEKRTLEGALEFAEKYNAIGKKIKENGLQLFYHNHLFEFEKFNGKTLMDTLIDEFDARYVEFEVDTYFVQAAGANPIDWIYKTDGRMSIVHLKDLAVTRDKPHIGAVGQGNLNWQGILKACRDTKVKYSVVELHSDMKDPIGSLKSSIDYIHSII